MDIKNNINNVVSEKRLVALVLCKFTGVFGGHRFYVGKTTSAVFQLLTLGGLGIWAFIDFILILFGVGKLPEIGSGMGKAIKNFKHASDENEIDITPEDKKK